jgi:hypothetical protein
MAVHVASLAADECLVNLDLTSQEEALGLHR